MTFSICKGSFEKQPISLIFAAIYTETRKKSIRNLRIIASKFLAINKRLLKTKVAPKNLYLENLCEHLVALRNINLKYFC